MLGNTVSGFSLWLERAAGWALGIPMQITCDPSDLLALPFLGASILFWRRIPHPAGDPGSKRLAGALAVLAGAVLTVANSAAPQMGVEGLSVGAEGITACTAYEDYLSTDGGFTWSVNSAGFSEACQSTWDGTLAAQWQDEAFHIRYNREAAAFEWSPDGTSWQREYAPQHSSQAGQALFAKRYAGNLFSSEGPLDAVMDPVTGNIVVAMGLDGVLVRTPDGAWQQAAVGAFYPHRVDSLGGMVTLLGGELALAFGLFLLLLGSAGAKLLPKVLVILPLVLGWMGWGLVMLFQPALYSDYPIPLGLVLIVAALFIVPVGGIGLLQLVKQGGRSLLLGLLLAMDGFVFFLGMFILWALELLPSYNSAMLIASVLALMNLAAILLIVKKAPGEAGPRPAKR